jgi:hypothetical protein
MEALSLNFRQLIARIDKLTLPGWFVLVDDKAPEGSTGALRSLRPESMTVTRLDQRGLDFRNSKEHQREEGERINLEEKCNEL